jgi:hypothetical protein
LKIIKLRQIIGEGDHSLNKAENCLLAVVDCHATLLYFSPRYIKSLNKDSRSLLLVETL